MSASALPRPSPPAPPINQATNSPGSRKRWVDGVSLSPATAKRVAENLKNNINGLKKNLSSQNLKLKTEELTKVVLDKMKLPPFLRLVDKISFTAGVILMLLSEYIWVDYPESMYKLYVLLIVPLLLVRFFTYHARKWHYFMLDFCYFCQLLLIGYIYVYKTNPYFFQLVFCLCSGPLGFAVIPWKNSIVFHDWDRMTSVFIHIYPPIVVYTLRWYGDQSFAVCPSGSGGCGISLWNIFVWPLAFYTFWQVAYIIKTELMDKRKLEKDKDLVTSLRWLADLKPHPIYRMAKSKGYRGGAFGLLVAFQFCYTVLTLTPMYFLWNSFWTHTIYLSMLIMSLIWAGASYYFEVFSER